MGWTIGMPSLKLNNAGQKSKHCGSFGGVSMECLEERKGRDPDINPELAHLNIYEGITSAKALMAYSAEHVSQMRDAQGRKLRKDAVVMCSTIVKPPAEMMLEMSREDQIRFLRDAVEKLTEIVSRENVRSTAYHFDEQGAHVHVLWEPMTPDGRLCAKEMHNLQFFGRLNREMPQHLRECGWDVDDCKAYDAAAEELENNAERRQQKKQNGRSSAVYKRDMELRAKKLTEELEAKNQLLEQQKKLYDDLVAASKRTQKQIQEYSEVLHLIRSYEEYLAAADGIEQDLEAAEAMTAELPSAAKLFQAAAAQRWVDNMLLLLQKAANGISAGIQRLKVFELSHKVPERRSEPAERRAKSLDEMIAAANQRSGTFRKSSEKELDL